MYMYVRMYVHFLMTVTLPHKSLHIRNQSDCHHRRVYIYFCHCANFVSQNTTYAQDGMWSFVEKRFVVSDVVSRPPQPSCTCCGQCCVHGLALVAPLVFLLCVVKLLDIFPLIIQ